MSLNGLSDGLRKLGSGFNTDVGGGFTPASLSGMFSVRDVGGQTSPCFTTTGGSTICTDGTAAARVVDAKSSTYNALASTSAPTYKVGANGKPYLEFNGSGNRYDRIAMLPYFTFHCLNISAAGYHNVFDAVGMPSTGFMFWIGESSTRPEVDVALVVGSALTVGTWYTVFTWRTPGLTQLWINGVSAGTAASKRSDPTQIDEFNRAGASTYNGKISAWGYGMTLPSVSELSLLHNYCISNIPT
jgi:hypothetical protein